MYSLEVQYSFFSEFLWCSVYLSEFVTPGSDVPLDVEAATEDTMTTYDPYKVYWRVLESVIHKLKVGRLVPDGGVP